MSVKSRIFVLFAALFVLFLSFLFALWHFERMELLGAIERTRNERTSTLEHWVELSGNSLRQFARDYSQWDEMVSFSKNPSPEWSKINIDASLDNYSASSAWLYDTSGKLIYGINRQNPSSNEPPFDVRALLGRAHIERFVHCFVKIPQGLLELRVAPLHPSADIERAGPPLGWFIAGALWNQTRIASLVRVSDSLISLKDTIAPADAREAIITVALPLKDIRGVPVSYLTAVHHSLALEEMTLFDDLQLALFAACCLSMFLMLFSFVRRWILEPLDSIGRALFSSDHSHLDKILSRKDEFGEMARVVANTAMHQKALENEVVQRTLVEDELRDVLEARARLSRNLHDGVIQTLYATGMGLGGVHSILTENPQEALLRLDQTRDLLNEVIRDLRSFIVDMEPESLKHVSFTQAIQKTVDQMRSLAPFEARLNVDESAAADLPLSHRVHVLQCIREAISNSLRHGAATSISISLIIAGHSARLVIEDNGRGFPPGSPPSLGKGLENLTTRAHELGGTLEICSVAGSGARIQLDFPLPVLA